MSVERDRVRTVMRVSYDVRRTLEISKFSLIRTQHRECGEVALSCFEIWHILFLHLACGLQALPVTDDLPDPPSAGISTHQLKS